MLFSHVFCDRFGVHRLVADGAGDHLLGRFDVVGVKVDANQCRWRLGDSLTADTGYSVASSLSGLSLSPFSSSADSD